MDFYSYSQVVVHLQPHLIKDTEALAPEFSIILEYIVSNVSFLPRFGEGVDDLDEADCSPLTNELSLSTIFCISSFSISLTLVLIMLLAKNLSLKQNHDNRQQPIPFHPSKP